MEKLTHVEEETMQAVWRTGEGNVKAFMENMNEPAPYTTVASTVKNLEKKGYLSSRLIGNVYLYKPTVSEADYKKKFMGSVVKEYFDNSDKLLVRIIKIFLHNTSHKLLFIICFRNRRFIQIDIPDQPATEIPFFFQVFNSRSHCCIRGRFVHVFHKRFYVAFTGSPNSLHRFLFYMR